MTHIESTRLRIHLDPVADTLDELADLCEYWKKHRSAGRTPKGIRLALTTVAQELPVIVEHEERLSQLSAHDPMEQV